MGLFGWGTVVLVLAAVLALGRELASSVLLGG